MDEALLKMSPLRAKACDKRHLTQKSRSSSFFGKPEASPAVGSINKQHPIPAPRAKTENCNLLPEEPAALPKA